MMRCNRCNETLRDEEDPEEYGLCEECVTPEQRKDLELTRTDEWGFDVRESSGEHIRNALQIAQALHVLSPIPDVAALNNRLHATLAAMTRERDARREVLDGLVAQQDRNNALLASLEARARDSGAL